MKRALKDLQQDERERQEDNIMRAEQEREEEAVVAQFKQKTKDNNYSTKWKSNLDKWDALGLQWASEHILQLPRPDPPGTSL
jgi:hypothetical protein